MKSAGKKLKQLLKAGVVVMPGAYDGISAHLIKNSGFKAGYITGAGLSVSLLGKPDIGLLTLEDIAPVVRNVAAVVDIPFLVDVDTGFGGVANVARVVQEMEAAGAAGIQIEDQEFPKRCGHLNGKKVVSIPEMVAKVRAACAARKDKNFVVVARTDARGVSGLKEALIRAKAYKEAGADIIFPEALQTVGEFRIFGRQKTLGVLMANMTEFGRSPALSVHELASMGFRLVLYPMTAFRVAAFAIDRALHHLRVTGSTQSLLNQMQTRQELYSLIRYDEFIEREKLFSVRAKKINHKRKK
ncbi:MAG: Carboxyvinyl-carboxyphosphonate phosphorylmutase [Elusimicrobia bacterium]|nr:Carboxyvinyl-carboxyphosphonate phosphorylmutase [Elusimicrobiota bacterium]